VLVFNYSTFIDPLLKDMRTCVVELSGVKAGDRVLDVGCGWGDQVFHFVQKGSIASGVDRNPNMIELAERMAQKRGFNQASFRVAGATELPFPDGYFDIVSISLALHEMRRDERNKAVSQMKRVVKKRGVLMFIDFQLPLAKNFIGYGIRAIEFIAGRENYRNFRDFFVQGGLPGILKENLLIPLKEALLLSGNIQAIKVFSPSPLPLPLP